MRWTILATAEVQRRDGVDDDRLTNFFVSLQIPKVEWRAGLAAKVGVRDQPRRLH